MNTNSSFSKEKVLNSVKTRLLFLSPTVSEGLERECNKDDFEALDEKALGKGGFGHVWKVRHKVTGKIYAIKVISKDYIRKENMVEQINRETEIMYRTDHPYIIKLYNHYEDEDNFYLIMHCASKGQLYSQLKRMKRLDEKTVAQYIREVISAVIYLHSMKPPIIHRDIKPENVLIDSDGRAKLADFGWSNFYEENKQRETYCGTPEYLAPEMVTKSGHNESIDIWSIGVLMFELLAGRPPFVYKGDTNALYNDIKNLKIRWTDDFPIMAKNLLTKILRLKPQERPSLIEILDHPWFKEIAVIRPIIPPYEYDKASKLRSHLINLLPEEEEKVVSEIKSKLIERRESLKNENISSSNKTDKQIVLETDLKQRKDEISLLKEELAKKDKIIEELKLKIENYNSDQTTLKIRDKEKESFINEVEAKNKKLLEIDSELNLIKNEHMTLDRQFKTLKENYDDALIKNTRLDRNIKELNTKINTLEEEKQQEILNYEKKLRMAELNYVIEPDNKHRESVDPDKILNMTKEYLSELVELIKTKVNRIEDKILQQERNDVEFRGSLTEQIDKKINYMVQTFKETHERIIAEEKNLSKKQIDEIANKNASYSKSLDWYKAQINELFPFKQKCNQEGYQLSKLSNDITTLTHVKNVLEEKNSYMESYIKSQNESVENLRNAKERYKNAFLEAEKLFSKYVKDKNLRNLINFKDFSE